MNIEIKDEILNTLGQPDNAPRYSIRDNNGSIIYDNVQLEMKTPLKQEGTPINKKLFQDLYNEISPKGIIKSFSSMKDRKGYLLCDGSMIYKSDYPEIYREITSYDIFQILKPTQINPAGGSSFKSDLFETNNKFFITTNYSGDEDAHVWYSDDGYTWTKCISDMPNGNDTFYGAFYVNGVYYLFVRYNKYPTVFYGSNLNNLTQQKVYNSDAYTIEGIAYNNDTFVVVVKYDNTLRLIYSTNGTTWKEAKSTTNSVYDKLFVLNNTFYLYVHGSSSSTSSTYTRYESTDGINWTSSDVSTGLIVKSSYPIYDNYVWQMNSSTLQRTNDLQTWEDYKTYDKNFGSVTLVIDKYGVFYLIHGTYNFAYSFDLDDFNTDLIYTNAPSSNICANDNIILTKQSSSLIRIYLDGSEAEMTLPTLIDKTNQIYGYIQIEGA